jgi:hypothetical protein
VPWAVLWFASAYGFLTNAYRRWQTPCGLTLKSDLRETIRAFKKSGPLVMDIERINQIGTLLTDLAARTEALRGYL